MSKWVQGKVVGKRRWTDRLVSLKVEAPEVTFVAGQFGRLALPAPPGSKEEMLGRPYSFVNSPNEPPHEFYFNVLPDGPLSPRLAALAPGDPVWLLRSANGFFSISEVPVGGRAVVPVDRHGPRAVPVDPAHAPSPGRNSAASCSSTRSAMRRISPIATRSPAIGAAHPGAFAYVPMVSREPHPDALAGRIPAAIARWPPRSRAPASRSPPRTRM